MTTTSRRPSTMTPACESLAGEQLRALARQLGVDVARLRERDDVLRQLVAEVTMPGAAIYP